MNKVLGHFLTIVKHKVHVARYCFAAGLYRQGIVHDISKFSPTEFVESVKYFQGDRSPILAAKDDLGYSMAWQHHKGRNKHHYEYWQDDFDHGGHPLQMPFECALELVCDYLGAGRTYMDTDFSYEKEYEWWQDKKSKPLAMHPQTIVFVEKILFQLKKTDSLTPLRRENARLAYEQAEQEYRRSSE